MVARGATTISVALTALVLALAGCNQPTSGPGSESPAGDAKPVVALRPADVKLKIVDGAAYQETLAGHKGKVVLVDYWATWCEPCKENFPHIVELHRQHADKGLVVLSLSIDDPAEEATVRKFLADHNATFDHMLGEHGSNEKSLAAYDYTGAVPLYKLYDRSGQLKYQFGLVHDDLKNGQPIKNLDQRVAELLAESP